MKEAALPPSQILTAEWVLPVAGPPVHRGFVRVEGGRLMAVGALAELGESASAPAPEPGSLLTPGLVNVHTHLEQTEPQPLPRTPGQPFTEWLLAVIQRNKQAASTPQSRRQRCEAGIQELLGFGTTCINDVASGPESLECLEVAGMRAQVAVEFVHPAPDVSIEEPLARYRALAERYRGHPRLAVGISPHSPYNVSPEAWQAMLDALGTPRVHTHVAEFQAEVDYLRGLPSEIQPFHERVLGRHFGPSIPAETPMAYLERFKLLTAGMTVAHAVHTNRLDREALAEAGGRVAHCPRSNLALHGKTLDYPDWRESGIPLGLGTDGKLSTEDLDLRAEARLAMQLHGWDARTALKAMTYDGARVMGWEHAIGTLEAGKQADLVLWQSAPGSEEPPENRLLAATTQAMAVWIEGASRWQRP